MIRIISSIIFLLASLNMGAQTASSPQMADGLRADGKIWVVVGVIALVFVAIVGWLVMLEKRIGNLERSIDNHRPQK